MTRLSDSLLRAQAEYQIKCKVISIRFNRETEPELIEWLEAHAKKRNTGTIIKDLIREEIKKGSA